MKSNVNHTAGHLPGGRLAAVAALLVCLAAGTSRAAVKHLYTFNTDTGTTVQDSVGGMNGTVVDAGSNQDFQFAFGQLDLTNNPNEGSNGIVEAAYVDLPNGIVTSAVNSGTAGAISFEFWASVSEVRTWNRFGDFGTSNNGEDTSASGTDSDYVLITPNSGRVGGDGLEITNHPATNAGEPNAQDNNMENLNPFGLDVERQVVAVYDHNDATAGPNGTMSMYLDGLFIDSDLIHADFNMGTMDDNNNWLGRSQWNDPMFAGSFNEFRIYDHAVSAQEVADSFAAGPEFLETVVLDVQTTTGAVQMRNATTDGSFPVDFYQIDSEGGALDPLGWNSLSDQDGSGDGDGQSWDESGGGTTDNTLAELYLTGDTTFGPGQGVALGNAFDPSVLGAGVDGDLVFQISLATGGTTFAKVNYVAEGDLPDFIPIGPTPSDDADFNGDGVVDGADEIILQRNYGAVDQTDNSNGDANGDGMVDGADQTVWNSQFGGPPPAAAAANAAVPEPGSIALAAIALALAGGLGVRKRS